MNRHNLSLADMPEIIDATQISQYLKISYAKSLETIKYGGIPHRRIGNQYRVPKNLFIEWLNKTN